MSPAITLFYSHNSLGSDLDIQIDNRKDTQAKGHLDWEGDFKGGKNYEGDSFYPFWGFTQHLLGLFCVKASFPLLLILLCEDV